jgi:transposase-like protein
MSPTLLSIVLYLIDAAKENQTGPVVCCWCNNRVNIIKYGKYQRYGFTSDELIDIQRYLCKHDQCRRTFSILPHPFLRISRFSLCLFNELLRLCDEHTTIAEIARCFAVSWPTIPRSIKMARRIVSWIRQEAKTQPPWAPHPCMHPCQCWSEFIRMFAAKFYPKRYA